MMIRRFTHGARSVALAAALLPGVLGAQFSLLKLQPRDLSQLPETPSVSWNLGPTGLRGWVLGSKGDSAASREILVVSVDPGSPAVGKIQPFDILTGVGGRPFTADARRSFGEAIAPAEAGDGVLTVTRWRKGIHEEIQLQIGKLPAYADSGKCLKSDGILARSANYVAAGMPKGGFTGVFGSFDALFLMAAGNPEHMDEVRDSAHRITDAVLASKRDPSLPNWEWSHQGLLLAEYYLATKDRKVLPGLQKLVDHLEAGQAASGSWGHSPAVKGQTKGYGEVNSVGLTCLMTLTLARECGLKVTAENHERAYLFFRRYMGIGSIPYGDHEPWLQTHAANGKNAGAAIAMMLIGDREAAGYFSRMTAASVDEREQGHTGNFFSYFWGPAGVGIEGDAALADFLKPQRWYYDLARRWDGSFITQPWPHKAEGKNAMTSYINRGPLACTPSIAMAYAVSLKKLRIFGRAPENG